MPLDPSIILGVKPLQVDFEKFSPVNALTSAMKIRQLEQEGELNALNLSQRKGLQEFLATKPNLTDEATHLRLATEFGEAGRKTSEGVSNVGKARTEQFKQMAEKAKLVGNMIAGVNDDIGWQRVRPRLQQLDPTQELPETYDPKYIAETQQEALGIEKALERHFMKQDTGGAERVLSMSKYGPGAATVVPGSAVTKTVSPDAAARLAAESATGALTPESLDVAANVYLQTGQLPTGLGKAAAGLRTQVMNRATELSTGKAPADVAGGIVGAKLDVASRGKAIKDFSTGIQGRQVNAFNTAVDHLTTMDKLTDALNNGDLKAINSLGNVIARQTGQPAPTNFDAAKQIVTAEVIKAVVASGGGVTERQEAERNFAAANSPEQLKGIINTYQDLLGGQLKSLNLQYENTTGRKDFDKKLTPAAQQVVSRVRGDEQKAAPVLQGQDKQALEWANANPKDPRAAAIKQRLGL